MDLPRDKPRKLPARVAVGCSVENGSTHVLAIGEFSASQHSLLDQACAQASLELRPEGDLQASVGWFAPDPPRALMVHDFSQLAEAICLQTRAHPDRPHVPIVSLVDELSDLSFEEVFSWSGDDVVELGQLRPLVARLRRLPPSQDPVKQEPRGTALIAATDRMRRIILGHGLRQAGYRVGFAVSEDDTIELSMSADIVIAGEELGDDPVKLAERARTLGCDATWVTTCAPRHLGKYQSQLELLGNAVAMDGFVPPENVVYLVNELARGGASDKRASRRLLYGTTVSFRGAGRERDDHGFSYNISSGGLYLRTLAPPEEDQVWLEVRPPRCDRLVRLEGQVMWRRGFGTSAGATVPPGFGVKITDATRADLSTWQTSYDALDQSLLGRTSLVPSSAFGTTG